jgi:hypothetical protein
MPKKHKPDKQKEVTAQSFKRIAKELKKSANAFGPGSDARLIMSDIANIVEDEAVRLRGMR